MAQPSTAYSRGQRHNEFLKQGDIVTQPASAPAGVRRQNDLFRAIKERNFDLFNRVLIAGADPNGVNRDGISPLNYLINSYPVMKEPEKFLYVLLNSGANVNAVDSSGMSPLELAFKRSSFSSTADNRQKAHVLIEMLLKKGAEPNIKTHMIVDASDDVFRARVYTGYTPLHAAVLSEKPELVELLLTYGADRNPKNDLGETPLDIAVRRNNEAIVKILTGPIGPPNGFRKKSKRIKKSKKSKKSKR